MSEDTRIHGMDAARASMMLLGVLLHCVIFAGLFMESTGAEEDLASFGIFSTIHTFRMPAFFLLAGFFAGLLIAKRGPMGYLRNRARRLGLVLVLLAPALVPLTLLASGGLDKIQDFQSWVEHGFGHLWFVYYLLILSFVTYGVSLIRTPEWLVKFQTYASFWITDPKTLLLVPMLLLGLPAFLDEGARIRTSTSLVPDLALLGFYALFFWFGSLLFSSGKDGLDALAKRGPVLFAVGFVASQITFSLQVMQDLGAVTQLLSMFASFYLAFGVIGVFLRLVKTGGRVWGYLTRTSYWVYLVHLPIVYVALQVLAYLALPALLTAFIAFFVSVALALASFELLVRKTPLAKLV
jgi:hypothetical protein